VRMPCGPRASRLCVRPRRARLRRQRPADTPFGPFVP
jgi:hypothetical protein